MVVKSIQKTLGGTKLIKTQKILGGKALIKKKIKKSLLQVGLCWAFGWALVGLGPLVGFGLSL